MRKQRPRIPRLDEVRVSRDGEEGKDREAVVVIDDQACEATSIRLDEAFLWTVNHNGKKGQPLPT